MSEPRSPERPGGSGYLLRASPAKRATSEEDRKWTRATVTRIVENVHVEGRPGIGWWIDATPESEKEYWRARARQNQVTAELRRLGPTAE